MLVVIRGAGDIASGIALRLWRAGIQVVLTDIAQPTAIRRSVAFSQAILEGASKVEDVEGRLVATVAEALACLAAGTIPVLIDPAAICVQQLRPAALVDAILAKRNLGTKITDAPVVVAVGPGFTVGTDCHAAVETMRGHDLGRVIRQGGTQPNTAVPGYIGGFAGERVLRAPADGVFRALRPIGALVTEGETVGEVAGQPMRCTISGVLRGILPEGTVVQQGLKSGDVDPRGVVASCYTCSDKAMAVGGGVLEAILTLTGVLTGRELK